MSCCRFDVTETQSMGFFVRRENWDDKAGTKTGTTTKNNTTRNSAGLNWWLTDAAVLKIDWEKKKAFGSSAVNGVNLGMGYSF